MELLRRSLFLGLVNLSFCHSYTHAVFKLLSNLAHSGARVDLTISSLLIRTDKAKRWYLSIFLPLVYLSGSYPYLSQATISAAIEQTIFT